MRDSGNTFRSQEFARESQRDAARWQNVGAQAFSQGVTGAADSIVRGNQQALDNEFRQRAFETEQRQQQQLLQQRQQQIAIEEAQAKEEIQLHQIRRQELQQNQAAHVMFQQLTGVNMDLVAKKLQLDRMRMDNERLQRTIQTDNMPNQSQILGAARLVSQGLRMTKSGKVEFDSTIPEEVRKRAGDLLSTYNYRSDPDYADAVTRQAEARAQQAEADAAIFGGDYAPSGGAPAVPAPALTTTQQKHYQKLTTHIFGSLKTIPPEIRNTLMTNGSGGFARLVARRQADVKALGRTETADESAALVLRQLLPDDPKKQRDPAWIFAALASPSANVSQDEFNSLVKMYREAAK